MGRDFAFAYDDGPIKFDIDPSCQDKERIIRLIEEYKGELVDNRSAEIVIGSRAYGPARLWKVRVLDQAWVTQSVEAQTLMAIWPYLEESDEPSLRHLSVEDRDWAELVKAGVLNSMARNAPYQVFATLNRSIPHKTGAQWQELYLQSRSDVPEIVSINIARVDSCLNECILSIFPLPGLSARQGFPDDIIMEDPEEPSTSSFKSQDNGVPDQSDSVDYPEWSGIKGNIFASPHTQDTKPQATSESESSGSRTVSQGTSTDDGDEDRYGGSVSGGPGAWDKHDGDDDDGENEDNEESVNLTETGDEDDQETDDWEGDPELLRNAPDVQGPRTRGIRYSKVDYKNMARFVRRMGAAPYVEEWDMFNHQLPENERRPAKNWQVQFQSKRIQIMGADTRYNPKEPRRGDKIGRGWRATQEELDRMAKFVNKVGFGKDGQGPKLEEWRRFWSKRVNGELINQDKRETAEAWYSLYYNRRREIRGIAAAMRARTSSSLSSN